METILPIAGSDPYIKQYEPFIRNLVQSGDALVKRLKGQNKHLADSMNGYFYYGLHRSAQEWVFREWAPNATDIWLIGDFNNWTKSDAYRFARNAKGDWELKLPSKTIHHGNLYKLKVAWSGGEGERIPAWANRVVQDPETLIFSAKVWAPEKQYEFKNPSPKKPAHPLIYEAHVGMSMEEGKVASFEEFRHLVLPRIARLGYTVIQLMAIQEHPYYGSFGYHVSSFFAASSRFGTPEELKQLIDEAHGMGICVIMDLVHSHAVKNEVEGLGKYDGTRYQFFHDGSRGQHPAWDSLCFDYAKPEVLHFLLSNCKYWLDEYHFDGFRFDGVTSMLYHDHGLGRDFLGYADYFNSNLDLHAAAYLRTANLLIHQVNPDAITIAEDMSGFPGMASPIEYGGLGFDFRLAMGIPDFWIKTIKEVEDQYWQVGDIFYRLTDKRDDEQVISYVESHDQALVGDKTVIFRLIDAEMYYSMRVDQQNLVVDRGMALHKMLRLITLATSQGGYLNFMGNEFGHPEWIDFPRKGNNWSYHHARRQWSLSEDKKLKYRFLLAFDQAMIQQVANTSALTCEPVPLVRNQPDQVLVFQRGDLLFVFNFNPTQSFENYGIEGVEGHWKIILNTDNAKFGGFNRIDETIDYQVLNIAGLNLLRLYIPARCAIVLKQVDEN
jgi:1,4-alpha-glucan branching enzyme